MANPFQTLNAKTLVGAKSMARRNAHVIGCASTGEPWDGWKSGVHGFYWTTPANTATESGYIVLAEMKDGGFGFAFKRVGQEIE